jgi:hypothetical protein
MKARTLLILITLACLAGGCSYNRVIVETRVQSQITPVVPVVVAAKIDLSR